MWSSVWVSPTSRSMLVLFLHALARRGDSLQPPEVVFHRTWEKQVLSARRFKRVGRHSDYTI